MRLNGADLEQAKNFFLKTEISKDILLGHWHSFDDFEFPLYVLKYANSQACIITVIDDEERCASWNYVDYVENSPLVGASWHFRNGKFTHEIERNFIQDKTFRTQGVLEGIAKTIGDHRAYFSQLDEGVQDCLREAYELAERL